MFLVHSGYFLKHPPDHKLFQTNKKDAGFYYDHRKTYSTQYVIIPNGGRVLVQRADMSTYAGGKATYKESTDPNYQTNEDIYLGEFGHHVQTIMK